MYNLFIVNSPLQFLGAIEARDHFKTKDNILIVTLTEYEKNNEQIHKLLKTFPWNESIILNYVAKQSKFLEYLKIIKKLQKRTYDYIFIGDFQVLNQLISANLKKHSLFLLDDGVATLNLHKHNLRHKKQLHQKFFRRIRYNIFGLKTAITDTVNYFSIYDLKPHRNEQIEKNNFNYLKTLKP